MSKSEDPLERIDEHLQEIGCILVLILLVLIFGGFKFYALLNK